MTAFNLAAHPIALVGDPQNSPSRSMLRAWSPDVILEAMKLLGLLGDVVESDTAPADALGVWFRRDQATSPKPSKGTNAPGALFFNLGSGGGWQPASTSLLSSYLRLRAGGATVGAVSALDARVALLEGANGDAPRLAGTSTGVLEVADWNLATESGWYFSSPSALSHAPDAVSFFFGRVDGFTKGPTGNCRQTAVLFDADSSSMTTLAYQRDRIAGAFGPWYRSDLSRPEADVRYLRVDAGRAVSRVLTSLGLSTGDASMADDTGFRGEFEIGSNGIGPAMLALHRNGSFGCYFGLDTDNRLKVGGWAFGDVAHRILHAGDLDAYWARLLVNQIQADNGVNGALRDLGESVDSAGGAVAPGASPLDITLVGSPVSGSVSQVDFLLGNATLRSLRIIVSGLHSNAAASLSLSTDGGVSFPYTFGTLGNTSPNEAVFAEFVLNVGANVGGNSVYRWNRRICSSASSVDAFGEPTHPASTQHALRISAPAPISWRRLTVREA